MPSYIEPPITTDPDDLSDAAFAYIQSVVPGWQPNAGNIETILIESIARIAAELRTVASAVPTSIFRYYGDSILGLSPIDDAPASGATTWTARDNLGYTVQAGTVIGLRAAGDNLIAFETVNTVVIPPGSTATAAGAVSIRAIIDGTAGNLLTGTAELIDPLDWVSSVVVVGSTGGGVEAEEDEDYLNRLVTRLQLLSPRPILPNDFAVLARDIAGVNRALAIDGYNPNYNILTLNQASAETDATGWSVVSNSTVASTSAQAADGTKSVLMTTQSNGNAIARTPAAIATVAVIPGETWTALVSIRAATTVRSCQVRISWYTAASAFISSDVGVAANDSNTGWTQYSATGIAPATAAYAVVEPIVNASVTSEVHYLDKAALHRGSSVVWSAGGTPETGQERMITVALVDEAGNPVSAPIKAAVDALLQAEREVNFVVTIVDPTINLINVTTTYKVQPGQLPADVDAAVTAALQNYLNPANWGRESADEASWVQVNTVRYLELATVINNVPGVDYITSLTFALNPLALGTADVTLSGVAPLAKWNSLSVTGS